MTADIITIILDGHVVMSADSGDAVIQEQGFSIVDTHEPAIAMPVSPFCLHMIDSYPHGNEISLVGRHQGVC